MGKNKNFEFKHDKSQRRILTIAERVDVIKTYTDMPNKSRYVEDLSIRFNCGRTQIRGIIKDKLDILKEWNTSYKNNRHRIRRKTPPEVTALGKILSEWVTNCLKNNIKLNTALIRYAATEIIKLLEFPKFRPTNRWMDRFLKKYRFIDIEHVEVFHPQEYSLIEVKIEDVIVELQHNLPPEVNAQIEKLILSKVNFNIDKIYDSNEDSDDIDDDIQTENNIDYEDTSDNDHININTPMSNSGFEGWDFIFKNEVIIDSDDEKKRTLQVSKINENSAKCPIKNLDDAINYLKPLQEYGLLTSNTRAINFIVSLQNLFNDQKNSEERNEYILLD